MSFLIGIALLLVGVSYTKPNAQTVVTIKAHTLPSINVKRGHNPLTVNNFGIEISRIF